MKNYYDIWRTYYRENGGVEMMLLFNTKIGSTTIDRDKVILEFCFLFFRSFRFDNVQSKMYPYNFGHVR